MKTYDSGEIYKIAFNFFAEKSPFRIFDSVGESIFKAPGSFSTLAGLAHSEPKEMGRIPIFSVRA